MFFSRLFFVWLLIYSVESPALDIYQAAQQGDAQAQNNLGFVLLMGQGVPRNEQAASYWFHQAATQGHAQAQNNLGVLYLEGNGVTQDYATAIKWFCAAAKQSFSEAQRNLQNLNARCDSEIPNILEKNRVHREFVTAQSENLQARYAAIDAHVLNTPPQVTYSVQELAAYLVEPAQNDYEKARAIYRWVTANVAYDAKSYFAGHCRNDSAQKVLRERKAVCSGYANLFEELGKSVGLNVRKVEGMATTNGFSGGHAWNQIHIDGNTYWTDSTWGAGYLDEQAQRFIPSFNEDYFLVSPQKLASTHHI